MPNTTAQHVGNGTIGKAIPNTIMLRHLCTPFTIWWHYIYIYIYIYIERERERETHTHTRARARARAL